MPSLRILSYNVNGIRAASKKGWYEWLNLDQPDIVCVQETKAQPDQLSEAERQPDGYHAYFHSAEKKGYSGVAIFSKVKPNHVEIGCGIDFIDQEGRVIRADYDGFSVISLYAPSGSSGEHRQDIKEEFMKVWPAYVQELRKTHPRLLICGDYNIAHTKIDIHDPVGNKKSSGFLPHEREWFTDLLALGYVDTFRQWHPDAIHQYSWWSHRANARANNKGWRIDYHLVTAELADAVTGARILPDVMHSDHCPIEVSLQI
ncbi:MAG: exodeoxyribonuclease III [Bacteroidia bacterium]|nr:exodeoxyribonuclease III [Bacteroidia bacterium]